MQTKILPLEDCMQYIKQLFSVASLLLVFAAAAQNQVNSPYSAYALGDMGPAGNGAFSAIGGANLAFIDSTQLNFDNPASYNAMANGIPLFSTGVSGRMITLSENGSQSSRTTYDVQHFALAFPVWKHFGLGIGLKPFATRNYELNSGMSLGADSMIYKYKGRGDVNELFLGVSTDLLKMGGTRLAVGANFGYLFGELSNVRMSGLYADSVQFAGSWTYPGGVSEKQLRLNAFHLELGMYLTQRFNAKHKTSLAFVYDPKQALMTRYSDALYYASQIDNRNTYDTVSISYGSARMESAAKWSLGLQHAWTFPAAEKKSGKLNTELAFFASYTTQNWETFVSPVDSSALNNSSIIRFGLQYSPEKEILKNAKITKFHQRMNYRLGYYSGSMPVSIGGKQIPYSGFSLGFGFPIVIQNSLSSLNLALNYGMRGNSDPSSLMERSYGVHLGITIAPGSAEKWFRKSKLN